ncbi:MAG TPA: class I SAM-dependent methyltransferase [Bryobacteraceae bacterium]|nr:class I SAM-dependent methyltransferase [Bryobacteraceae bacterium]
MSNRCVLAMLFAAALASPPSRGQDHMEHSFSNPEEWAKRFDGPERDAWQLPDRVLATLDVKPGQLVADIGSGTGYFSVRLAKLPAAPKVYGCDIEPSMVNYLRDRAAKEGLTNLVAVQAAADTPNLPEPVDLILIVDTYHHIGNRAVYFRKLAGSLKPGGRIAIVDFKLDSPEGPPAQFRFSPAKLRSEMSKAGFKQVAGYDFLPRQNFLVFAGKR